MNAHSRKRKLPGWALGCGVLGVLLFAATGSVPARAAGSLLQAEGLGRWLEGYDLAARGAGWTAIGITDPFGTSAVNPAAVVWSDRPRLGAGFLTENLWMKTEANGSDRVGGTRIPAVQVVVPGPGALRWGFAFRDLTDGRYGVRGIVNAGREDEFERQLVGTGGLSELSATLGARFAAGRLAVALRGGIVSGTLREEFTRDFTSVLYDDSEDLLRTRMENARPVSLGLQGRLNDRLSAGFVYDFPATLDLESLLRTTTAVTDRATAKFEMPAGVGLGASVQAFPRWRLSLDVLRRFWSESKLRADQLEPGNGFSNLEDTTRLGFGVTRVPDPEQTLRDRLARRTSWRFGFTYGTLPATAQGETVSEWALTAGAGLPIQFDRGFIDGLVEFGKRGDAATTGLSETFLRIGFGATFQTLRSAF